LLCKAVCAISNFFLQSEILCVSPFNFSHLFSKRTKNVSYLDPAQIVAAETLATFSTKLGKLPPNRKATDGISKYLEAIRAVAIDRMESEWGKGSITFHPLRSQTDFDRFRREHTNGNHFDSPSYMVRQSKVGYAPMRTSGWFR